MDAGSGELTGKYWWGKHAWGSTSFELLLHLQKGEKSKDWSLERVVWYADLPHSCDVTGGQSLSTPDLAMPGKLVHELFLALGEPVPAANGNQARYDTVDADGKSSAFDRWKYYNQASEPRGMANAMGPDLTHLSSRASKLAASIEWSGNEIQEMVEMVLHSIQEQRLFYEEASGKPFVVRDSPWEEALASNLTADASGVDGRWNTILKNPYLPLNGTEPGSTGYVFRKVAEAILDPQEDFVDSTNPDRVSLASLEALVANPNTPSDLIGRAHELTVRLYSNPHEKSAYYADGDTISVKEGLVKPLILAAEAHPNFVGERTQEPVQQRCSSGKSDEELVQLFLGSQDHNWALRAMELCRYVPDLMTDPSREALVRDIVTKALADEDRLVVALFLPAAATILEEFLEEMGASAEQVPFEWLITAAT